MDRLTQNIEQAAAAIDQIRQQVLTQQADIFAKEPGKRPSIREMEQTAWINSQQPIAWPSWPPGILAKAKALMQKLTRRGLQWYIDPIVQQQNQFNQATLRALSLLAQEVAALQIQHAAAKDD